MSDRSHAMHMLWWVVFFLVHLKVGKNSRYTYIGSIIGLCTWHPIPLCICHSVPLCIWHPVPLCMWHPVPLCIMTPRSTPHMPPCFTLHMTPCSTLYMSPCSTLHMTPRSTLHMCNEYNGFWDLTWLLSGGGSKDSQLFRQQCCKVIYTSKGPCR